MKIRGSFLNVVPNSKANVCWQPGLCECTKEVRCEGAVLQSQYLSRMLDPIKIFYVFRVLRIEGVEDMSENILREVR